MKLDFLKTLNEQQPCGLRAVIEPLSDSYPVMAFSDWKELAIELIDDGFVSKYGNGQYRVTPAGSEAIEKGAAFLEEDIAEPSDDEGDTETNQRPCKPATDHPWRQPLFTKKQMSGESPMDPRGIHGGTRQDKSSPEKEVPAAKGDSELDGLADSLSTTINRPIEKMSTDELLTECRLSKDLVTSLQTRRELAVEEITRRMEGL